jgi:hypothetical protein
MDSIRQPFFASAVATTDRVLASQVVSIFSTQILNTLRPADIGAVAGTNPTTQSAVYFESSSDLNLLGPVGTKQDLYTVPSGYRLIVQYFSILFTDVTQSGVMSGTTQPRVRIVKNNSNSEFNKVSNEIQLDDAGQTVQISGQYWITGGGVSQPYGKASVVGGETISAYITQQFVTGTNPYTVLKAKCFGNGWMIPN